MTSFYSMTIIFVEPLPHWTVYYSRTMWIYVPGLIAIHVQPRKKNPLFPFRYKPTCWGNQEQNAGRGVGFLLLVAPLRPK